MNGVFEEIDSLTGKIEPTFWQEYWAWFVAAAMLLAFILGFLTRKKNKPAETPLEKAMLQIKAAAMSATDSLFAFYVSAAVREYISEVYKMPAPERTTEEFLKIASNSENLDEGAKKQIAELLTLADLAKFAGAEFGSKGRSKMSNLAIDFVESQDAKINAAKK